MNYLNGGNWTLVGELTEVESGKRADRPELGRPLAACKKQKAKLVIAKLWRAASSSWRWIECLMNGPTEFQNRGERAVNGRILDFLKFGDGREGMCGAFDQAAQRRIGNDDVPSPEPSKGGFRQFNARDGRNLRESPQFRSGFRLVIYGGTHFRSRAHGLRADLTILGPER
jgi:hypothetical protein